MTLLKISACARRSVVIAALAVLAGCAAQQHHSAGMSAFERSEYAAAVLELQKAAELRAGDLEYRRDWLRAREAATDKLLSAAQEALAKNDRGMAVRHYLLALVEI